MKHKLKITILSILFGLLFGIPVYADSNTYIIDQSSGTNLPFRIIMWIV